MGSGAAERPLSCAANGRRRRPRRLSFDPLMRETARPLRDDVNSGPLPPLPYQDRFILR